MSQQIALALLAGFVGLLGVAALCDARTMRIPNRISLLLVAAFLPFAPLAGLELAQIGLHLGVGLAVLAGTFALFALGLIGGGDAKLIAAAAVWFGASDVGGFLFATAMAGGVLTLAIVALRAVPVPAAVDGWPWLARLRSKDVGVPYGIAIAAGAFVALPQSAAWRLAIGA
ncbi:A24 family peptidase [Salinarimonas rosea]|uniref:A24 family peptidase n=1 Tax=Salinarimonas rosea TaxID=552063 RepID=UPI0004174DFF|nr:prepilin peptidase [Salinarimonas rosea]